VANPSFSKAYIDASVWQLYELSYRGLLGHDSV